MCAGSSYSAAHAPPTVSKDPWSGGIEMLPWLPLVFIGLQHFHQGLQKDVIALLRIQPRVKSVCREDYIQRHESKRCVSRRHTGQPIQPSDEAHQRSLARRQIVLLAVDVLRQGYVEVSCAPQLSTTAARSHQHAQIELKPRCRCQLALSSVLAASQVAAWKHRN